jgi:Micrococcal nuclease (thermonuclease) homologs
VDAKNLYYYAIGILFVFLISQLFMSGHSGLVDKVYSISKISQSENEEIYKIQEIVTQNQNGNTSEDIELEGIVSKVIDGDTLDINGTRIRLALVDTPERGQGGFDKAKILLSHFALEKRRAGC